MGRRGPKTQPTALKIARGNPHGHALPEEPQFDPPSTSQIAPPDELTGFARDEWIAQVDILVDRGVITVNDLSQFRMYCEMMGEQRELRAQLQKSKRWTPQKLKLARYHLQLRARVQVQGDRFGLTPSSRSGIVAVKSTANAVDDKRRRFFGKRKEKPA